MGLFDDLSKALKQVEDEVKKSDPDKARASAQPASPAPSAPAAAVPKNTSTIQSVPRSPHPGYAKIAAWMKRNYKNRITGSGDNFPQGLQLEQLTAEACSGFSAKTKKGFMDYLKKQNYEPLLK
jgi:hypothetical protein